MPPLVLIEDLAHREDMADRALLQLSHALMNLINGGANLGAILLFVVNRGRKSSIAPADRKLELGVLDRKTLLQAIKLRCLLRRQIELVVNEIMQPDALMRAEPAKKRIEHTTR